MILLYGIISNWMERRRLLQLVVALGALTLVGPAMADDTELARELLEGTDDLYRGQSSTGTMAMTVQTARWTRTIRMRLLSQGTEKSLIVILDPPKEAGMATLKVDDNIWNYLPNVDRTMKVPASMMSGAWMGSHFSNDDLVKESRMADDYTFAITQRPGDNDEDLYVVECTPHPDAPVVWGKVVVKVREDRIPTEITYWDEQGELARTMLFEEIREMGGRTVPTRMKLVPADKPEEYTEMIYESLEYDVDLPESTFTLQSLRQ
jgi:outer membrane lipoprotein-sorting protein